MLPTFLLFNQLVGTMTGHSLPLSLHLLCHYSRIFLQQLSPVLPTLLLFKMLVSTMTGYSLPLSLHLLCHSQIFLP